MPCLIVLGIAVLFVGFLLLNQRTKHYCSRCGARYAWKDGRRLLCPECGKEFQSGIPVIIGLVLVIVAMIAWMYFQ